MSYLCGKCTKGFPTSMKLENHQKKNIPCDFVCNDCGEEYYDRHRYYRHKKSKECEIRQKIRLKKQRLKERKAVKQIKTTVVKKTQDSELIPITDFMSYETYADLVLVLYRPEYYKIEEWDDEEQTSTIGEAEIIIAKNKNGILDNIRVKFDGRLGMFDNLSC